MDESDKSSTTKTECTWIVLDCDLNSSRISSAHMTLLEIYFPLEILTTAFILHTLHLLQAQTQTKQTKLCIYSCKGKITGNLCDINVWRPMGGLWTHWLDIGLAKPSACYLHLNYEIAQVAGSLSANVA